jgi:hypothetical protein
LREQYEHSAPGAYSHVEQSETVYRSS